MCGERSGGEWKSIDSGNFSLNECFALILDLFSFDFVLLLTRCKFLEKFLLVEMETPKLRKVGAFTCIDEVISLCHISTLIIENCFLIHFFGVSKSLTSYFSSLRLWQYAFDSVCTLKTQDWTKLMDL